MKGFSIIMPYDGDRESELLVTFATYQSFGFPDDVEFLLISRKVHKNPMKDERVRLIEYHYEGEYFNPSKAFNIGIQWAKYDNIIITCPEVSPKTNVLEQLGKLERGNYVCQVFDQEKDGSVKRSLVNKNYRSSTPSMYFLACFKKEDIKSINGWDEDFMLGYAYEDDDFGARFVAAGKKFEVMDDIQGIHLWHPRGSLGTEGARHNELLFRNNVRNNVIRPVNGLEYG